MFDVKICTLLLQVVNGCGRILITCLGSCLIVNHKKIRYIPGGCSLI